MFTVVEIDGRAIWRRVGSGHRNEDGSYDLLLEALPVNGKLQLRELES